MGKPLNQSGDVNHTITVKICKLLSCCQTTASALKSSAKNSFLTGLDFLRRPEDNNNSACSEHLMSGCYGESGYVTDSSDVIDGAPFERKSTELQWAKFSQFAVVEKDVASTMQCFSAEAPASPLLRHSRDCLNIVYSHMYCHCLFGGLVRCTYKQLYCSSRRAVSGSHLPRERVEYPYAAFMMACCRLTSHHDGIAAHEVHCNSSIAVTQSGCAESNTMTTTVCPGVSDIETATLSGCVVNSDCSRLLEVSQTDCCDVNPIAQNCHSITNCRLSVAEDIFGDQHFDSGFPEESTDMANMNDHYNPADACGIPCIMEASGVEVKNNDQDTSKDTGVCIIECEGNASCSTNNEHDTQIDTDSGEDTCDSCEDDSRIVEDSIPDEEEDQGSDDEVMWDRDSDTEVHVNCCSKDSTTRSSGSSFFVRGSCSDDSDDSTDSDDDEVSSSEDDSDDDSGDEEEDDDDDWLTPDRQPDLSCIGDLDPFQVSGLYIPSTSTTPVTRSAACQSESNTRNSEAEDTEPDDSNHMKRINEKWNQDYGGMARTLAKCQKKVSFGKISPVHIPVLNEDIWAEDYRTARCTYWEEFVRDRDRFKRRICETAEKIESVLKPEHRAKIIQKLCLE